MRRTRRTSWPAAQRGSGTCLTKRFRRSIRQILRNIRGGSSSAGRGECRGGSMDDQKDPKSMPACSHAEDIGRETDREGVWSDPEAILRPTEGERLKAVICEFEDERYPQMMA